MKNQTIAIKSKELFKEIDEYLEGSRYYSKSEIKENQNNFISAIINKDTEYLERYYDMIEDEHIQKIESLLAI